MKNKIAIITSLLLVAVFSYTACDDDSELFVVSETAPVTLSELGITMIELDFDNTDNPAATFNWTVADFGQPAEERYALEVSMDEAFTNPVVASRINGNNTLTVSVGELNSAAGNAGLVPLQWQTLYARIVASIGTQNDLPVPSNVISFEVFPFFNYRFTDFYIVGNATMADWNNNNNNPPLFRDADNESLYTYTGFFTKGGGDIADGRFKVIETRGEWQPQWGTTFADVDGNDLVTPIPTSGGIGGNPPGVPNPNDPTDLRDPGRIGVQADGFYTFTFDFGSRSYSIVPFDSNGNVDYTSMTVQGSALATDASMTQSTFDNNIWFIPSVRLVPGELQITTNTGANWGSTNAFSGVATEDGGSIPIVVEDDYEIWFNDLTGDYIIIPLNF